MTSAPQPSTLNETDGPPPRRLVRGVKGALVAGVSRGVADRFDVDANIVRVIFVVLTLFWGLGAAIYLILWVVLPRAGGEEAGSDRSDRPPMSTSHRLSTALSLGALVALVMLVAVATGRSYSHLAPNLALVWLVFLVALAAVATRTAARRLTLRRLVAVVVLTGLSVLILAVGVLTAFVVSTGVPMAGGNGVHVWQPTTLRVVRHRYLTNIGAGTVDLSEVSFGPGDVVVSASVAVGTLRVVLPRDAVVSVTTHVGVGTVHYFQGSLEVGSFDPQPPGRSPTAGDRPAHLTINASVGVGSIDIVRAGAGSTFGLTSWRQGR